MAPPQTKGWITLTSTIKSYIQRIQISHIASYRPEDDNVTQILTASNHLIQVLETVEEIDALIASNS